MILKEILTKLVKNKIPIILFNSKGDWTAEDILKNLSESKLKTRSHYQPGLYIAEINESGYLGSVLYRIKKGK